jgi:hypothetical protein
MSDILQTALVILGSIGAGGAIVLGLSGWLGKVWANRLMENDRARHAVELATLRASLDAETRARIASLESDLIVFRDKHLKTYQDKIMAYRGVMDIAATLVAELTVGPSATNEALRAPFLSEFEKARLRLYGYLGMLAPQNVMDAHDRLMDLLFDIVYDGRVAEWTEIRALAIAMINEIRRDIDASALPIEYTGKR